jgi:RNA polymerase sigma-70 factor (ECF subfamily)
MNAYRELSDSELTVLLQQQDKAALEEVYLRYWAVMYQHARKIIHDSNKAEDIVQDIFIHLLTNMENLHINTPLKFYLYRAIRNRVIDNFKNWKHQQKYIDSLKGMKEQGEYITDETILENELKKRIEQAITDLPPQMRKVFEMSRIQHLSYQEIAETTNTSVNTIKTTIQRALKSMRAKVTSLF